MKRRGNLMNDNADIERQDTCESKSVQSIRDNSISGSVATPRHELVVRGVAVIDRGRRGAKHEVIALGRTVIDRRIEE
jgi:hypothetical protein